MLRKHTRKFKNLSINLKTIKTDQLVLIVFYLRHLPLNNQKA